MGALLPTPNDLEIVSKLNNRFSSTGLPKLVAYQNTNNENLFDAGHSLHRVALRLGTHPSNAAGKGRWFFFLKQVLSGASGGNTINAIKYVLGQAIANAATVDSVVFSVFEDPNATGYHLYPNNNFPPAANPTQPLKSKDKINGKDVYLVTLVCPKATSQNQENDPPRDNGEPENSPPIP